MIKSSVILVTLFIRHSSLLGVFLWTCFSSTGVDADDWPHWRGPERNDKSAETGLLAKWPKEGPERIWLNQSAGLGYAGIAIVGDRLFTLGLEDESEFALCLNAKTGEEIWRQPIGPRYQNGWGDGPRSTPSVDGDRVYVMAAGGTLACLNATDGSENWKVQMQDFGGSMPYWGFAESPLVDDDRVVCTPGGDSGLMVALNKMTGETIWQSDPLTRVLESGQTSTAQAHYSSVLPIEWKNEHQYIQLTELAVVGVSADNGKILWQSTWPGRVAVIPSPIFDEKGQVYVTSGYGIGSKLVQLGDNNSAIDVWYNKVMQNLHGGVIQVGDFLYGSSDQAFVCQSQKTGERIWAQRIITKGAATYADGHFYHVQESDGKVLLFSADENGPELKGNFVIAPQTERRAARGRIWVHPVISDGKLYLRDQEIIYCFDVSAK